MIAKQIETESACFDIIRADDAEQVGLENGEIACIARNHAGEEVFMILRTENISKIANSGGNQ